LLLWAGSMLGGNRPTDYKSSNKTVEALPHLEVLQASGIAEEPAPAHTTGRSRPLC